MSPEANFGSILDKPSNSIEKPKPVPVGTYLCVVQGLPRFDKSSRKGTEFVEYTLAYLQAGEDVSIDDLAEMSGIQGKTIKATYYLTEDAVWRLKKFLDDCGVEEGDRTLRQRLEEATNCQVLVKIKHEASQDGTSVFAKIADTASAE